MFTIEHANINVADMARSVQFYGEAFGLTLQRRKQAKDGSYEIVFLKSESGDFALELTWLKDMDRPYNLGDNESHIGFAADDFDAAYALHSRMGIICYENKKMGVYFIEDPDGYWQEVKPVKRRTEGES